MIPLNAKLETNIPEINNVRIKKFQNRIMKWFRKNKREFPWRDPNRSPYEILIAEIMLQKTRAENIVNTYLNFINKYPNFVRLSKASFKELSGILEVLGLSKIKAKNLTRLAKEIKLLGEIPKDKETLIKLPGIGPYIANAFSISAFCMRLPVVDTNVRRLYNRLFSFESKKDPRRDKNIWILAKRLLPKVHCKEFTWAIMDFCATVCNAKNPICHSCPLNDICDYGKSSSFDS